ncbi:MAG TPA: LptA/OstA family protein [Bryobacteraceae bacterium]|nr:LptA/OstA family protein [Bryobacteraceae bacterium]
MRGARWLLLVVMAAIVSAVGITYRDQKRLLKQQALPKPASLPAEVGTVANQWHYSQEKENNTVVEISAGNMRQAKDAGQVYLTAVELRLHHKAQGTYDLVKSPAATYFSRDDRLYSDGEVDITLAVPDGEQPNPNLTTIHSTGVTFDTNTGKAETARLANFTFRNGHGACEGATYDPTTHDLHLLKNVAMYWNPPGPNAKPMKIEATSLYYHELTSEVWLKPWGRLTRDQTVVEGYESVVRLEDKAVRTVETNRAQGTDQEPNRKLQYGADNIFVNFNDDGVIEKITGNGNAQVVSASESAQTTLTASRVEMNFRNHGGQSELVGVNASGASTAPATAKEAPLPVPGRQPGETHILRSDSIQLTMQPGGKDIQTLRAPGAGTLEFLPNLPAQHHRTVTGRDFLIAYAPQNRIDSFHAKDVKTSTDPSEDERRRNIAVSHTTSRELSAQFEPNSSQVATIEQIGDFTYEQGPRHARAAKASLDNKSNLMILDGAARVSDDTGATTADRIRMDQHTGDFLAEGNVKSMRLPDKGQTRSGMLSGDEPLESQARKMLSSNRNKTVHYEGDVHLWQGANRLEASTIDIDRNSNTITADGSVASRLWEQPKADTGKGPRGAVLTVVHAPHLVYTDQDRLAVYSGGVVLDRQGTHVKARVLHAYLAGEGADSRLVKAIADGNVEISQTAAGHTRQGKADHCEYYTADGKVVLTGGDPQFTDSIDGALKGYAHGVELTYFSNDDRLLVTGSPDHPAKSRIRRH